jgi:hypothetical protein
MQAVEHPSCYNQLKKVRQPPDENFPREASFTSCTQQAGFAHAGSGDGTGDSCYHHRMYISL